ncbi:uncharacterized protein LOC136090283 isoform X2 [Hydra vulgaris]|uniref:Uncharacterized protein LOC136090283 isoform X2 n=1 Tax=Hydra vulgaris TaxID=6087 RepID=A0ABM4DE10_HYDVU
MNRGCIFLNFTWRNDDETKKNCTIIAGSNTVSPKSLKDCEWSTFNNDSCLNILLDTLKNACAGFKLAGEFFAVKLRCYSRNTMDLNSEFCLLFTLQKEILKENENFLERIEKETNVLNASLLSPDYSAKQPNSLRYYTRQPNLVENNKAIIENKIANTTHATKKSMLNKNVVTYVVLACGVLLFLLIGAFYLICRLSKRYKGRKMTIESGQLICMSDATNSNAEIKVEDLYAFPNKKKIKFKSRLHKKRGQWKGYDTVNTVIPGTYIEHSLKANSCEKGLYANALNTSPKAIHSSPILGEDIPFKRIVGRSSFTPKRFPLPEDGTPINEETLKEANKNCNFDQSQELLESEANIQENQLKNDSNVESKNCLQNGNNTPEMSVQNENVSFFKPGTSVRIKQQRTSRRSCTEGKTIVPMRELVHEDVSIMPPIPKQISPDLNNSRVNSDEAKNSFKKKSPAVPKRTSSIKIVKQVNENVSKNSPKMEQQTNGLEMSDSKKVEISFQNSSEVEIKTDLVEINTKAEVEPLFEPKCNKDTNNHNTDKSLIKDY